MNTTFALSICFLVRCTHTNLYKQQQKHVYESHTLRPYPAEFPITGVKLLPFPGKMLE